MAEEIDAPKVSVVMSLYNSECYLAEAIDSVLAQTFQDFEFIIIDDGSKDSGEVIVRSYHDPRIRFFKQENTGLPGALNMAISKSRAGLVARMDPDDECMPGRLQHQYEFMEKNADVIVLGTSAQLMDADGKDICVLTMESADDNLRKKFPESPFVHPSVMFRKAAFDTVGGYPEYMRLGGEDAVLFGKMAALGKFHNLKEVLLRYRLTPGALSRKPAVFREVLKKIVSDAIDGRVNRELLDRLAYLATKANAKQADFDYHFEIAKLYLWSGCGSGLSRAHSWKCISIHPYKVKAWLLYLIGWMPPSLIKKLYFQIKGRDFFTSSSTI